MSVLSLSTHIQDKYKSGIKSNVTELYDFTVMIVEKCENIHFT